MLVRVRVLWFMMNDFIGTALVRFRFYEMKYFLLELSKQLAKCKREREREREGEREREREESGNLEIEVFLICKHLKLDGGILKTAQT